MADYRICRICLRTEAKMYKFNQYNVKFYYEELTGMKINDDDSLPHYFCYECATMLHKFHKFKEKCFCGQEVLRRMLWDGPITYESVYQIDRISTNLKSSIDNMTVTTNIKTFVLEDPIVTVINTGNKDSQNLEREKEVNKVDPKEGIEIDALAGSEDERCIKTENKDVEVDKVELKIDVKEYIEVDLMTGIEVDSEVLDNQEDLIGLDSKPVANIEQTIVIEKEPKNRRPQTIFVDAEKGAVKPKYYKFKKRKNAGQDIKKKSTPGKKTKNWGISEKYWKVITLYEEEALKEFRARIKNPKYETAAYQCRDCFKGFSKEDMLKRHFVLRHKEELGKFECRFCHFRFRIPGLRKQHMQEHFLRFHCLRCPYVCPLLSSAVVHEQFHNGVTNKCLHCGQEFSHLSSYYSHLRKFHRSEHICTLCGESFVSEMGLQQHKKIKHIPDEIDNARSSEDVNTFCDRCDIRFESWSAYQEHIFHSIMHAEGYGATLEEKDVALPPKVLGRKIKEQIKEKLQKRNIGENIPVFDYSNRKESKRSGCRRKLQKKPTTCHQCGKEFDTQTACFKHHNEQHPRTSFYPDSERQICEICGMSLALGSVLSHQNTHTREKTFRCETCGREFNTNVSMKRHQLTHTGEKPYGCTLCDKKFTQENSMKLHYRHVHLKEPYPKRNRTKKFEIPKIDEELCGSLLKANKVPVPPSGRKTRSMATSHDDTKQS